LQSSLFRSAAENNLRPDPARPDQGWAWLGGQAGTLINAETHLLDKQAPEIPVAHQRMNPAGYKAVAKLALAGLFTGIGEDFRNCSMQRGSRDSFSLFLLQMETHN